MWKKLQKLQIQLFCRSKKRASKLFGVLFVLNSNELSNLSYSLCILTERGKLMNQELIKNTTEIFVEELLMIGKHKNQFIVACLVAILIFAAISCFFSKLHIPFAIPFFGLFFLHVGWTIFSVEAISSANISSYLFLGIHFIILILWACFLLYIWYQMFVKVWEGVYFIILIILNLLLIYLKTKQVTSISRILTMTHHLDEEKLMLSLLYIICIISILFIMLFLYWKISNFFSLGSTKTIQRVWQIGLFVLFLFVPIVPICLIGILPFTVDDNYNI